MSKSQSSIISEGRTSFGSEINSHLQNTLNQREQVGFGWLCYKSHRHRGHLETAPQFTVPYEVREGRFLHRSHRESNPGRRVAVHYITAVPRQLQREQEEVFSVLISLQLNSFLFLKS